jgi:hypothetical protein
MMHPVSSLDTSWHARIVRGSPRVFATVDPRQSTRIVGLGACLGTDVPGSEPGTAALARPGEGMDGVEIESRPEGAERRTDSW